MKLIKMKNGYVNADMIESFAVVECKSYCDIVAYSPSFGGDCESYTLGKCSEEYNAYMRIKLLAEWLTENESGVIDVMNLWESDN